MDWREKLAKCRELGPCRVLEMGKDHWFVQQHSVEIGGAGILSSVGGRGRTPEEAVEAHWRELTELPHTWQRIVVDAYKPTRRSVRWNGTEWGEGSNVFREVEPV